ncbi:MAG TPA: RlpA-like double-psi beta-barrel domain-containing protein [Acetobacteraceae bacterium]|nr:RlpA-like double-psi beta-barrel domain-containing protein [Acetobacteraceae bacterium]
MNDRGPFVRGRVVDVSQGTAERLGMRGQGTAQVAVTPLRTPGEEGAAPGAVASR